mmetsp:Transcript_97403/g.300268  ORF Transcript_97403/g.300268 Transcript_97403/m.300268 type:complete len:228 (+) Transcript_97403:461-1144(+)
MRASRLTCAGGLVAGGAGVCGGAACVRLASGCIGAHAASKERVPPAAAADVHRAAGAGRGPCTWNSCEWLDPVRFEGAEPTASAGASRPGALTAAACGAGRGRSRRRRCRPACAGATRTAGCPRAPASGGCSLPAPRTRATWAGRSSSGPSTAGRSPRRPGGRAPTSPGAGPASAGRCRPLRTAWWAGRPAPRAGQTTRWVRRARRAAHRRPGKTGAPSWPAARRAA